MAIRHRTPSKLLEGKILDAALSLLDEQGFRALTVRGIATRAGVAPMGIYNRFENKTGIYDALWIDGFQRLTAQLESVEVTSDPVRDLTESALRYRSFAKENPSYYRLMFLGSASGFEPSDPALHVALHSFGTLERLVGRVQDAGYRNEFSTKDVAQTLWAFVHGSVSLELLGFNFSPDADSTYEHMLEAISEFLRTN
jgi:AcrR family transcriptional regulator